MTPTLQESYAACRRLNAAHGRTYYLATMLLPAEKRPHVHALYAFARCADEIVDDLDAGLTDSGRAEHLLAWTQDFLQARTSGHRVLPAVLDTISRFDIPLAYFEAFLDSMRMDLTVTEYGTYDDLMGYVYGSAAVIGLQMLPVLGHTVPHHVVAPYAVDLGVAFQLTNFIRDVGEDLRRGRLYLPLEDLRRFGVSREQLERGVVDAGVRELISWEIARARRLYRSAAAGIRLVDPASRDCLRAALTLYSEILDAVEAADYRVLDRRATVSRRRRAVVAGQALAHTLSRRSG